MQTQLQWKSHPVVEEPKRNGIVMLFLLLTGLALWLGTGSLFWAFFGIAVVLAGIRQWLLPTYFLLDENGVEARFLFIRRRKTWGQIRRANMDRHGLLLSPLPAPSRLDSFRGMYLRFTGNRNEVLAFVSRFIKIDEKQ